VVFPEMENGNLMEGSDNYADGELPGEISINFIFLYSMKCYFDEHYDLYSPFAFWQWC
jgi:hypothetical protein